MLSFVFYLILIYLVWFVVFPLALILFRHTLGYRIFSRRKQLLKAGEWAVITGGTDGLGKAYAEELASDGLNIFLISRNKEKLENFAAELSAAFKVSVKYVVADFTQFDIYERIKKEVDALSSIACLINNVGMVNVNPERYAFGDTMRVEEIHRFIACNCLSTASMTQIVLPRLCAQNSGSALINVSSFSGLRSLPYITLYGATKSFVSHLSESLELELSDKNILVQTLCPMYVATSMVAGRRGLFVISPKMCAQSSLNMLGVESFCMGHWLHALQIFYFSFLPQCFFNQSMERKLERAELRKSKTR